MEQTERIVAIHMRDGHTEAFWYEALQQAQAVLVMLRRAVGIQPINLPSDRTGKLLSIRPSDVTRTEVQSAQPALPPTKASGTDGATALDGLQRRVERTREEARSGGIPTSAQFVELTDELNELIQIVRRLVS